MNFHLEDEAATVAFGRALGEAIENGVVIYLEGRLGSGKTTLCRGVLRAFGYSGAVKSPTYTLVEPYELGEVSVYHFDLYRLADPEELEYVGLRDYLSEDSVCLIEWPERGRGFLPSADLTARIGVQGRGRSLELESFTARGSAIAAQMSRTIKTC